MSKAYKIQRSSHAFDDLGFDDPYVFNNSWDALTTPSPGLVSATESANDPKTFGQILAVFDRVCSDVKFDTALARKIIDFQVNFVAKNEDHISFFGGVLTGVQVVRFTSLDMNRFFADVLGINELELEDELHQVSAVKAERRVSGDVFNHVCLWAVHKFMASDIPKAQAERAALAAGLILNYRFLTSLLAWYYKFPADPDMAQLAYSRLTKKSAIKQYGSWHALLEARVKDLLPPDGLHWKTVKDYKDDLGVIYALNDHQNRIRSMMKHLMGELQAAKHSAAKLRSTNVSVEVDGESFLRDKSRGLETYSQYVFNILPDEHTFVKQDLVDVLTEAMRTAPPSLVHETLAWMSQNYKTTKGKEIDDLITEVLVHSFAYLEDNRTIMRNTVGMEGLVMRLKGVYMSSRSSDPKLLKIRELSEGVVKKAIKSKNQAIVAAVRTSVMLYIVMRAFSMNHYSK